MKLYIRIIDGMPFEHPIFEDNFKEAFPHIDVDNLPPDFAIFERVQNPRMAGLYQVDYVTYQWVDGIVKDVWSVRDMTEEEKIVTQNTYKEYFLNSSTYWNFVTWTFNEEICRYVAPIPKPDDGKDYFWHGTTSAWLEIPLIPDNENSYSFDLITGSWVKDTL